MEGIDTQQLQASTAFKMADALLVTSRENYLHIITSI